MCKSRGGPVLAAMLALMVSGCREAEPPEPPPTPIVEWSVTEIVTHPDGRIENVPVKSPDGATTSSTVLGGIDAPPAALDLVTSARIADSATSPAAVLPPASTTPER